MSKQIQELEAALTAFGRLGEECAINENLPMCIELTIQCQEIMQKLMALGQTELSDGSSLAKLHANGVRLLKKYTN